MHTRNQDRISVVVCDQNQVMREGLRSIIEGDSRLSVVGQAADTGECLDVVQRTEPTAIVVTHEPPVVDGLDISRKFAKKEADGAAGVGVTLLAGPLGQREHLDLLQSGVRGLLPRSAHAALLVSTIHTVGSGATVLAAPSAVDMMAHLVNRMTSGVAARSTDLGVLTRREVEVLRLVAKGASNHQAASELSVSMATVKSHLYRMCRKLKLRDRTDAVIFAYESGLIRAWGDDHGLVGTA